MRKAFGLILALTIAMYITGSFISWELNPSKWHIEGRIILGGFWLFISILIAENELDKK